MGEWVKVSWNTWYYFDPSLFKEGMVPIDKPYAYHKPSTEGLSKINRLREAFSFVAKEIHECCPDSRQKSIAITNNEQTAIWAIKSVVFNDPKSEVEGGETKS